MERLRIGKTRRSGGIGKRSGGAIMRLLSDIRFGTERYPEKVARRLRTVNFGTRIAAAGSALFLALSLAQFTVLQTSS